MLRTTFIISLSLITSSIATAAVPRNPTWKPDSQRLTQILRLPATERHRLLAEQPDVIYDALISLARDERQAMNLRWRALTSAAVLRKAKAAPDLVRASRSPDWFMRNASLVGLAEFSPAKSVEVARQLVKDKALVVRSAAVDVLAKNGNTSEREILWKELRANYNRRGEQSLWIRGQIARALAEKPRAAEMSRFSTLLNEPDEALQKASVQGLQRLTGKTLGLNGTHKQSVEAWKTYFRTPRTSI